MPAPTAAPPCGAGHLTRPALACRFNRSLAAAAWRGAAALHCVVPAYGAGVVGVEVTQNGQQHTVGGAQFEYRHAVAHGVHPREGPTRGGSLLEVRGAGGHAAATRGAVGCRFGAVDTVGATHSGRELAARCAAPPAWRGRDQGRVRFSSVHFSRSDGE